MKDLIKKAIALGLGVGAAGKEQAEKLADKVQKQMGITKKESKTFVNDMIKRGEKIRKSLDKQIKELVDDAVENVVPVSRREFKDLEAKVKPKSTGKRKKTAKKQAKKTTKTTAKKPAKKTARK